MHLSAIAKKLGMHPSTIVSRVKRLKAIDAIRKYTVSIDWRKLGKTVEVAVLINCSPKNASKIAKTLSNFEEVIAVHYLMSLYDVLARVTLRDMKEYKAFIEKKLAVISEIKTIHAGIVLENFK
jgi:DNA-binding Lrp family transcriptional regulator